jgi:phenylacetate-coenzyme A ligase PaaK-like adenylate-forming protein
VEIIDGQRICSEGESGEVVLTTLAQECSPLIRYRTGDIAVLNKGKCKCGSSFPVLSQIQGRKNDFLIAADGRKISPYLLMSTMDQIREVEQYQIHQQAAAEYIFYIKPQAADLEPDLLREKIKNKYINILGLNSKINLAPWEQRRSQAARIKRRVISSGL